MNDDKRPSWDEYFMDMADAASRRATCDRGRSGAVVVRNKQLLVTGYVGSPSGLPHCDEVGHLMRKVISIVDGEEKASKHCVRTIHAEQNTICQAAKLGIPLAGGTLYCRMVPCRICAMLIINVGIVRVVAFNDYHLSQESKEMFKEANIELEIINEGQFEEYPDQV